MSSPQRQHRPEAEPSDHGLGIDVVTHADGDGGSAEIAHLALAAPKERDEFVRERWIVKPQSHHGRFPIDLQVGRTR